MTSHDRMEDFEQAGFLSQSAKRGRHQIIAECRDWFELAHDLNTAIMQTAIAGMDKARGYNWDRETVAVRLLLRTSGTFQGVIMMSERGMIAPSRTLVRTIVEDSFCAGAVLDKPEEIIAILRDDSDESRRRQAQFIVQNSLGNDPDNLANLKKARLEMKAKEPARWKAIAKLSTLFPQYLNYQRLSDDSLHTSALSLEKHVARNKERNGWSYRIGPGESGDVIATLHSAVLAALPVAIVVTQLLALDDENAVLLALSERFRVLPSHVTI